MKIIEGWLSEAVKYPSPHFNQRDKSIASPIRLLVIHNISLPPNEYHSDHGEDYISRLFMGTLNCALHPYFEQLQGLKVSAHCLITRQGAVKQYVSFHDRAWHAGRSSYQGQTDCNDFSIGIEMEGNDREPYTDAQYDALSIVTHSLMAEYPNITIPTIVGHCDIAPGRKTDPGASFDWARYRKSL